MNKEDIELIEAIIASLLTELDKWRAPEIGAEDILILLDELLFYIGSEKTVENLES